MQNIMSMARKAIVVCVAVMKNRCELTPTLLISYKLVHMPNVYYCR